MSPQPPDFAPPNETAHQPASEQTATPETQHATLPAMQHEADTENQETDDHDKTLIETFRERRLALGTMNRPLWLITGLAIAQLLAAALLVAARGHLPNMIAVASQGNQLIQMPVVAFVMSVLFLALAWSYLLTGALQTPPWPIGLVALALFTLSMRVVSAPGSVALVLDALLVAIWAVGLAIWFRTGRDAASAPRRGSPEAAAHGGEGAANVATHQPSLDRETRALAFGIVFALVLAYYGFAWWSNAAAGAPRVFTFALTVQLEVLSFALIPMLFLAGTDFAEWGELIAERISSVAGRARSPWVMTGLTALTALAILAGIIELSQHLIRRSSLPPLLGQIVPSLPAVQPPLALAQSIALGLVAIGILALIARFGHLSVAIGTWPSGRSFRVPYSALAASAVVLMGTTILVAASAVAVEAAHQPAQQADAIITTYNHVAPLPVFTIKYPGLWEVIPSLDKGPTLPTIIVFNGAPDHDPAQFTVVAYPRAALLNEETWGPPDFFALLYPHYTGKYTPAPADGPWQVTHFTLDRPNNVPLEGTAWQRIEGDQYWLLYGFAPSMYLKDNMRLFKTMVGTWEPRIPPESEHRTTGSTLAEQFLNDRLPGLMLGVLPLLLAIVVGMPLLGRWRQGRAGPLAAAGLFVAVAGVLLFFEYLPEVAKLVSIPGDHVPSLSLAGIQAAVALGTLGMLLWLIARRRLTAAASELVALLFVLNGGLFFIVIMVKAYDVARTEARFTIVQAIVLLVALLWDTLMSGESITNVNGMTFPRHTRVLLFLGYVMLVSSAVLYFSSWQPQAPGVSAEPFFESEQWPQYGLIGLGVPLLIAGFMMQLGRSRGDTHSVEEGTADVREVVET